MGPRMSRVRTMGRSAEQTELVSLWVLEDQHVLVGLGDFEDGAQFLQAGDLGLGVVGTKVEVDLFFVVLASGTFWNQKRGRGSGDSTSTVGSSSTSSTPMDRSRWSSASSYGATW